LTGTTLFMQPILVSMAQLAATLTPYRPRHGVITITGIGDHLRLEWPITITGTRRLGFASNAIAAVNRF
jgi:hypothetical protein